ncbi:Concanavalin A-like lectin/glucanases superfamily [Penicillium malachiteum]|uniref:Concanavalin A-like lectin/glucanases superfamily n=1 Tax=Penicillium malachiteum TaxID=1324776 RepID=UPI0025481F95|nr:Concanavalin A-like lectin/glucanases superfamily [Penicillium malachiteum]KAJ5737233.1 Concanavalin A-like lectin/glucanases superfamily [Penicillium malachiteum]
MTAVNPIIPGFAPDPSVVKVGEWYYLINSSFHLSPGLPIYVSKDLLSWHQIGNAIYRRDQLSLARSNTNLSTQSPTGDILLATGGLYAPTIRHHNGIFYVVCTNAIRADISSLDSNSVKQNFILSAKDIWANEWSDPVYFDFHGIDPSLFFDDGKVYVQGAAAQGISMFEINLLTGERISPERTIWTGSGGLYPEGPHIYKRNEWYYLMISEDGTHENHMVTMARSKDIWGPYETCPNNPILTARGTSEYIQHVGHCDAFEDGEGKWWGVSLGVRKASNGSCILGRETFLTSGRWDKEWLTFDMVKLIPTDPVRREGTYDLSAAPNVDFVYIRDADLSKYDISNDGTQVTLTASRTDLSHPSLSPTFVGKRQRRLTGESIVTLRHPSGVSALDKLKAGLVCYKDEHRYIRLFYEASNSEIVFEFLNNAQKTVNTEKHTIHSFEQLTLRMTYTEQSYWLSYRADTSSDKGFTHIASVDALQLTDRDFVGPVLGIFAVSEDDGPVVKFTDFSVK